MTLVIQVLHIAHTQSNATWYKTGMISIGQKQSSARLHKTVYMKTHSIMHLILIFTILIMPWRHIFKSFQRAILFQNALLVRQHDLSLHFQRFHFELKRNGAAFKRLHFASSHLHHLLEFPRFRLAIARNLQSEAPHTKQTGTTHRPFNRSLRILKQTNCSISSVNKCAWIDEAQKTSFPLALLFLYAL